MPGPRPARSTRRPRAARATCDKGSCNPNAGRAGEGARGAEAVYCRVRRGRVHASREIVSGVVVDLDRDGRTLGVEVTECTGVEADGAPLPAGWYNSGPKKGCFPSEKGLFYPPGTRKTASKEPFANEITHSRGGKVGIGWRAGRGNGNMRRKGRFVAV